MTTLRLLAPAAAAFCFGIAAAQQPMGTVPLFDAKLSGSIEADSTRATLVSNVAMAAYDHTAQITLARGGSVQLCATSALHLLHSGGGDALLFALDRGVVEIRTLSRSQDTILTPDLRFTPLDGGSLDLRLRISPEGDTCVDNRGSGAPTLGITEAFGSATYHVRPGQHVLFEHGSLRSVVDNEASDCGCPPATPAMVAATGVRNATTAGTPQQAAAEHPFPAAASTGLVAVAPPLDSAAAQPAAEATLRVDTPPAQAPASADSAATTAPLPTAAPPARSRPETSAPPPAPPGAHAIGHSIGNFFRRLFGRAAR